MRAAVLATVLALPLVPAAAQSDAPAAPTATAPAAIAPMADATAPDAAAPSFHDAPSADIIVTAAVPLNRFDALSSVAVLQGGALAQSLRPSLGDTLEHTPGVSASSFGPTASRPVLRGLQGERVRILTDGLGAIDASSTSADHAVAINPLLAERVEVLRGPQALLYSAEAIGGVVNVIDRRIPRAVPDEVVHVQGVGAYASAANERSGSASADVAVTPQLVLHADGGYLAADDLRIGGYALAAAPRAAALQSSLLPPDQQLDADGEPLDFAATAALRGKLPNSESRSWSAALGAAYITGNGNLGFSYSHQSNRYGVPVRYATLPGEEQEAPTIDLMENRFDARAEVDTGGGLLQEVQGRFGAASYRHYELEEDGSIGTAFYNKGMEGRVELVQQKHDLGGGAWTGATGGQFTVGDFDVRGDEAFLPKNSSSEVAFFTLQQLDFDAVKLQGAARFGRSVVTALPRADEDFPEGKRRFDSFSASLGASYAFVDGWRFGLNFARSARAPAAEELFANGPHGGTQSYEVGDPGLRTENSWGAEAVLRGKGEGWGLEASAFSSWYSSFIYEDQTGAIEDGFPVYQTYQGKARYRGFELQGNADFAQLGAMTLGADAMADYVRATITDVGPAPRIPPLRLLGGLSATGTNVDLRAEVEHVARQGRASALETPTAGYTLVNASATIHPWGRDRPLSLTIDANNIFDVVARRHASFLKDFAPLAGRDIRVTAQFSF